MCAPAALRIGQFSDLICLASLHSIVTNNNSCKIKSRRCWSGECAACTNRTDNWLIKKDLNVENVHLNGEKKEKLKQIFKI